MRTHVETLVTCVVVSGSPGLNIEPSVETDDEVGRSQKWTLW